MFNVCKCIRDINVRFYVYQSILKYYRNLKLFVPISGYFNFFMKLYRMTFGIESHIIQEIVGKNKYLMDKLPV